MFLYINSQDDLKDFQGEYNVGRNVRVLTFQYKDSQRKHNWLIHD